MELPESGNVEKLVHFRIETAKELIEKIEEYCISRMQE